MTIRKLYEWACENNALDVKLMKNNNLDILPIESVYLLERGLLYEESTVIVD